MSPVSKPDAALDIHWWAGQQVSELVMSDASDRFPPGTSEYEEAVRLTAYFLWEQDGRPEGREQEYWMRAKERHERQQDFDRMLADGDPDK